MSSTVRTWGTAARVVAGVAAAAVAVVGLYKVVFDVFKVGGVTAMKVERVDLVKLPQGWDDDEAVWFHHESQGTKIIPYDWFKALEQPLFTPLPAPPFAAREYLSQFGFLYDADEPKPGGDDLPIGFAVEPDFVAPYIDPPIKTKTKVVGLTCAACHTGRLDVMGKDGRLKGVVIEGGSAVIYLSLFQEATGRALFYTNHFRERFDRFARKALKQDLADGDAVKERLRADLKRFIDTGQADKNYLKDKKLNIVDSGFARTDALGLIGNRVFGRVNEENNVVTDAPVNFPHLWDTSWFDWVQYNASIRMPMARNIGEALGVGAVVKLTPDDATGKQFDSTVNVKGLWRMEELLGGQAPFEGLQPPKWDPELFGPIKPALAEKGKSLYARHCAGCHRPPRDVLKDDLASGNPKYFTPLDPWGGKRFLKVPVIDLYVLGTDPNQALNFHRRVAFMPTNLPGSKKGTTGPTIVQGITAKTGLFRLTSLIRKKKYEEFGFLAPSEPGPQEHPGANVVLDLESVKSYDRWRGLPPALVTGDVDAIFQQQGIDAVIQDPLGYKARPLDGIWATPPYFHNGSVPNLFQVLSPVKDRAQTFSLGSKRFDPTLVGYETRAARGAFLMDTSRSGNHNTGHEFRNLELAELEKARRAPPPPTATENERWAAVLGIGVDGLSKLTERQRWEKVRAASADARTRPDFVPIRGVIGVEFDDDERRQLVEYLKTL